MYEVGDTCKLKGDTRTQYKILEIHYEDDGETIKGYHLLKEEAFNHWILADRVKPKPRPKRKRGRK